MFIDIRAIHFPLTDAIRSHVEARVGSALAPIARRVRGVVVRVDDVNADRGGIDKRCRLVVEVRHGGTIVAEAVGTDLYGAVDEAARRVLRSLLRAVARPHARDRKDRQRPGALLGGRSGRRNVRRRSRRNRPQTTSIVTLTTRGDYP